MKHQNTVQKADTLILRLVIVQWPEAQQRFVLTFTLTGRDSGQSYSTRLPERLKNEPEHAVRVRFAWICY